MDLEYGFFAVRRFFLTASAAMSWKWEQKKEPTELATSQTNRVEVKMHFHPQ